MPPQGSGAGREYSELFMIDSGAGGVECMFHARAVAELGLLNESEELPSNRFAVRRTVLNQILSNPTP